MRLAIAVAVVFLAGCAAHSAQPTIKVTVIPPPLAKAETLYLIDDSGGDYLVAYPSDKPMEGWGVALGGTACPELEQATCWSGQYAGAAGETHAAGETVTLDLWVELAAPSPTPLHLEANLFRARDTLVAIKADQAVLPGPPGTPVAGSEGCVLLHAQAPLTSAVEGKDDLHLELRVDGMSGALCTGGGTDGNRLHFSGPGT